MKHPLTKLRWTTIVNNDRSFNGNFYYGVSTTKIFCLPSCPSKLPNQNNVIIFKTPQEALDLGFRPCKRCHPTNSSLPNDLWVDSIVEYLNQNFQQNISLNSLADDFHISASTIEHTFKAVTHLTPRAYLQRIRIEAGAKLLLNTTYSIQTIASRCGFNSDTYFSTLFKQSYQQTPNQFRNKEHN